MKREISAFALLLGFGLSGASAQVLELHGAATMYEMMIGPSGILKSADFEYDLDYVADDDNYGSEYAGTGEQAMVSGAQEIAPMARFLTSLGCHANSNAVAHAGCFRHSLYAVSVLASEPNDTAENCNTVRWSGTMALPSGGTYTFQDWRTVLRIIYGGQTELPAWIPNDPCAVDSPNLFVRSLITTKDCGGEIRRTLVNTWGNMFAQSDGSNCTNGACTALRHAFRLDDVSGASRIFLDLLALPRIDIGSNAPFCNGAETQDNDPIRRPCAGKGFADGEQVCKQSNPANPTTTNEGLGLVLPVLIPRPAAFVTSDLCAPNGLGGSVYGDVQMPLGTTICPNGAALIGGTCKWPRRTPAAGSGFDCLAFANDRPAGTASTFDGRAYNTILRGYYGNILNYQRQNSLTGAVRNIPMTSAYYRIHQTRAIAGSTLPANTGCMLDDAAQHMGCLIEASPCSIGFAEGAGTDDPNRKALGLRSIVSGSNVAIFPTKADVRLLLGPSRGGCVPDPSLNGGYEDRYPLSRSLYLCTVDGIPGFNGSTNWLDTSSQTPAQLSAQAELADIFHFRAFAELESASHFVALDDTGSMLAPFLTCADMGL